jgi:hypothetical protein
VSLSTEPVPSPQLGGGGSAAELCFLHGAAREADQVMVVARVAANVRGARIAGERANGARAPQEVDGSVHRREAELGVMSPRLLEEADGCEAPVAFGDEIEEGATLRREPSVAR